jgi:hypothetical protein
MQIVSLANNIGTIRISPCTHSHTHVILFYLNSSTEAGKQEQAGEQIGTKDII